MKKTSILILILALAAAVPAEDAKITVPLRFDHYYSLEQVYEAVHALAQAHPEMTKLEEVGKSEEGRPLYAVTLNNPKTGPALSKPAIYVDGNIHGNEIQGGEICLYLLDYLLGNYGKNAEVTGLLDKQVFYVVPVVNVDGRWHFFHDANTPSSNRSLRIPRDDDHDGLVDEDFPDDLDGDGNICMMRKRDPYGAYKTDPEDPRLMVPVKPGEKGEWTILGEEGIDNDGDGLINEDAEGYVDPNRQWGFDWAPEYVQSGSGDYPFQAVGLKALALWTQTKTNICMGWTFHNFGGMYLRGPSRKGVGEYPPQDVAVYDFIGKQAERITPGYKYMISWKDLYTTYGDSQEWLCQTMGAYGYTGEVYQSASEAFKGASEKKTEPTAAASGGEGPRGFLFGDMADRERLKYSDNLTQGELYKPWKPFKHPAYGDIEIGGWVKMSSRLGPAFQLPDLVHRNAMAVLFSAKHTPAVELEVTEVKKLGGDLYRVRTRLANGHAMPTMSYLAQKTRIYPKDTLRVSGPAAKVVAGGMLADPYTDLVTYKRYRPEVQFMVVPGFGKTEYQFLVQGKGEIAVRYESRHGGTLEKKVKLD
ncbi:MAG TPA: M14 family metallopeptidase [Terriglobales bacterium]|nr:M14 family metallopeptidase [Terriglobales bacterium]